MWKCAKCRTKMQDNDCQWESSLYSPNYDEYMLCETCGQQEEDAIEKAGTNDLPELLASYRY